MKHAIMFLALTINVFICTFSEAQTRNFSFFETSLVPGNYKELKAESYNPAAEDNVSLLKAGLKITVTL